MILKRLRESCLLMVSLFIIEGTTAADDWDLTAAERRRCATLQIATQRFPYQLLAPKGAWFEGQSVVVNGKPWLSLNATAGFDAERAANYARRIGLNVILQEPDLVVVDGGVGQQFYFYYQHAEEGASCLFFQSSIPTKADCLFRVKCAKTLARTDNAAAHARTFGDHRRAGIPLSPYPRVVREWSFLDGRNPFTAQLLNVQDRQVLLAADDKEITAPLAQLDADSRLIALSAEPYFAMERQLESLLQHASQRDPENPDVADWQQKVRNAERELSNHLITFRYRVTGISARSEPRHTKSQIGEYRLSLRPLYSCQIEMPEIQGRQIAGSYLKQYYAPAETFSPEQAVVGETTLEFSGRVNIHHSSREQDPHYQIAAAGSPRLLALTTPNAARFFIPRDDADAVERVFVAAPTAMPDEADVAAAGQDTPMPEPSSSTAPRRRVTASAGDVISVTGTAKRQLIVCRNAAVTIAGSRHDVQITGKCVKLTVSGTANRVQLNEVTAISVAGRDNLIEYKRGRNGKDPEISGVTRLNTIRVRP